MKEKVNVLFKNVGYTISSNLISLCISTIVILVLPKLLGVSQYGYWQLYLFYTTYIGVLHFGWDDGIYLRYGGERYDALSKGLFFSQFWSLAIFQVILFLLFIIFSFFMTNEDKIFVVIATACAMVLFNLRGLLLYVLQDTSRIREYALVTIEDKLVYILIVVGVLLAGIKNYKILIIADLVGKFLSLGFATYICKEIVWRKISEFYISFSEIWRNISVGINLVIANFASLLILGVIRYAVQAFWGIRTFAKVSLTLSVSNLVMTFITAVSLVLYPALSRLNRDQASKVYGIIRNAVLALLFTALLAYYPVNWFLPTWLPKYRTSLVYMAILFPMCVFEGKFELLVNTFMKSLRMEKWLLTVNLVSLVISLLLTAANVCFLKNITMLMFSVVVILAFRSSLGEVLITKKLGINVTKDLCFELLIISIFIFSSWFIKGEFGGLIYLSTFAVYVFSKRSQLARMLRFLRN